MEQAFPHRNKSNNEVKIQKEKNKIIIMCYQIIIQISMKSFGICHFLVNINVYFVHCCLQYMSIVINLS